MIKKISNICITILAVFKFTVPLNASEIEQNIEIFFADDSCKSDFSKVTLSYLEEDFNSYEIKPNSHFFYNSSRIEEFFLSNRGLIARYSNEFAGFLTWDKYELGLEIDIVEVNKNYREKGIFKKMVKSLIKRFPDTCVLTGSILQQSRRIFRKDGWKNIEGCINNNQSRYFKIVRPFAKQYDSQLDVEKEEYSIAVALDYQEKDKKYFKLNVDKQGKLIVPVVTNLPAYDSKIWIYKGKDLLDEGKAKCFIYRDYYGRDTKVELIGDCFHDMLTIKEFKIIK